MGVSILESLKNLSINTHVYSLDKNEFIKKNENITSFNESEALTSINFTAKKFYEVNGKLYAYSTDNFVYEISGNNIVKACDREFLSPPKIFRVKKGGNSETIIALNDSAFLVNLNQIVSVQQGDFYVFSLGRLFVAKEHAIYVSKQYPFDEDNELSGNESEILLDEKYGKIVGLFEGQNQIVVLTKKAIFCLKIIGDSYEYALEKIQTFYVDIIECSPKKIGDYVYFLSKEELYAYKNGRVESVIKLNLGENATKTFTYLEFYVIAYKNAEKLYAINTLSKEIKLLKNYDFICDEYAYLEEENKFYKISISSKEQDDNSTISKTENQISLDFDSAKAKSIIEIEIFSSGNTALTIKGDFGEREYQTTSSTSIVKCNLSSKVFTLSFSKDGVTPDKISIKYMINGE